jgi:hypothetical protein
MEPNIIIGKQKYFKEVKQCGEWLDCTKLCWPYVRFSSGDKKLQTVHNCCCLPCCFDFELSETDSKNKITKKIGQIKAAGCCDQDWKLIFCPCCYVGQKVTTKFAAEKNGSFEDKFHLRSNIEFCQYLCLCLAVCTPCVRMYRFCCSGDTYSEYEQNVYTADIENANPVAVIKYTDRMICPCIPDERVAIRIEQEEKSSLNQSDLELLSMFPTLVSGYTSMEFCLPLHTPGGLMMSLPTPVGISQIDGPNDIRMEALDPAEALKMRTMK